MMWRHEMRARVYRLLSRTDFIADIQVAAVHVNSVTRADRVFLMAFAAAGRWVNSDVLYCHEPGRHLDFAAEFDHEFTKMDVPAGSELEEIIACENGWVVDMAALRDYDLVGDRRATRRAVSRLCRRNRTTIARFLDRRLGRDAVEDECPH